MTKPAAHARRRSPRPASSSLRGDLSKKARKRIAAGLVILAALLAVLWAGQSAWQFFGTPARQSVLDQSTPPVLTENQKLQIDMAFRFAGLNTIQGIPLAELPERKPELALMRSIVERCLAKLADPKDSSFRSQCVMNLNTTDLFRTDTLKRNPYGLYLQLRFSEARDRGLAMRIYHRTPYGINVLNDTVLVPDTTSGQP